MNLPPAVWGPFFWMTIHITALGYPVQPSYTDKKAAKDFFESLATLLPCPTCREHYKQHVAANPLTPHLDKREDLFKWTVALHNQVNKMLGKAEWTEYEVMKYIERLGARARSPIVTAEDFNIADTRGFFKGLIVGAVLVGAGAGGLMWATGRVR